jgi:hypothetical protein
MGSLLRKLKAALGIGSIWGITAGTVGMVIGALSRLPTGSFLSSALFFGATTGISALVLGVGFGGLLALMEGRRTLHELTANRAAVWGFVAGAALALVGITAVAVLKGVGIAAGELGIPMGMQLTAVAVAAASYGTTTAGLAAATISLAKRSPSELPSGSNASIPDLLISDES